MMEVIMPPAPGVDKDKDENSSISSDISDVDSLDEDEWFWKDTKNVDDVIEPSIETISSQMRISKENLDFIAGYMKEKKVDDPSPDPESVSVRFMDAKVCEGNGRAEKLARKASNFFEQEHALETVQAFDSFMDSYNKRVPADQQIVRKKTGERRHTMGSSFDMERMMLWQKKGSGVFTKHLVQLGDTMNSIALKYSISPNELRKYNGLQFDQLYTGQSLMIPSSQSMTSTNNVMKQLVTNEIKGIEEEKERKAEQRQIRRQRTREGFRTIGRQTVKAFEWSESRRKLWERQKEIIHADSESESESSDYEVCRSDLDHIYASVEESKITDRTWFELLVNELPIDVRFQEWTLLFSTEVDGTSLKHLYRKISGLRYTVLLVTDTRGNSFGGFASKEWKPQREPYGDSRTFVFRASPTFEAYHHIKGQFLAIQECHSDSISFGGAGGRYALRLDGNLMHGTTATSEIFKNDALTDTERFQCSILECWGFAVENL